MLYEVITKTDQPLTKQMHMIALLPNQPAKGLGEPRKPLARLTRTTALHTADPALADNPVGGNRYHRSIFVILPEIAYQLTHAEPAGHR